MSFLPKSVFRVLCSEEFNWRLGLVSGLFYLLGAGLPWVFTDNLPGSLLMSAVLLAPLIGWLAGSFLGGEGIGAAHLGWLGYGIFLVLLLVFAPLGWLPGFYEVYQPLFWLPWGLLAVSLTLWISGRIVAKYFEFNVWKLFGATKQFDLQSLSGCFYATGLILLVFWVPLAGLRWFGVNYNFPLVLTWWLIFLFVASRVTYLAGRKLFEIDPFTGLICALWPLSLSGYWLLFPIDKLDRYLQMEASYLPELLTDLALPWPLLGLIGGLLVAEALFHRWTNSRRSWFIRPAVNSVIIGGLCLLALGVFTLLFADLFLTRPDRSLPDWGFTSRPRAEQNFKQLDEFGSKLKLNPEEAKEQADFDTAAYLQNIADTLQRGRKLLSQKLHYPKEYARSGTIPQFMSLIDFYRTRKLKARFQMSLGKLEQSLDQVQFMLEASDNLFKSQQPVLTPLVAAEIRNLALGAQTKLLSKKLSPAQRRRLHSQLLRAAEWPAPISDAWFLSVKTSQYFFKNKTFQRQIFVGEYHPRIKDSRLAEVWYLTFKLLQSSESIVQDLSRRYYHATHKIEVPYHRVDWELEKPKPQKNLLGYILFSPHRPLSSYLKITHTGGMVESFSRKLYESLSRGRQLLYRNRQAAEQKLSPVPRSFQRDPLTGKPVAEIVSGEKGALRED